MTKPHSRWHGKKCYFGFHYDLHAKEEDTLLGTRCSEKDLLPMLQAMKPDFVQTDCKGHPGYTSWFSKTPDASVPPQMKKDAMKQWRAVTKKLGLPLHCHYSGIWEKALAKKHPEWCVVAPPREGEEFGQNACSNTSEMMCVRSDYVTKFMIPQMIELIDDYDVDGFWIDGDLWASSPCYCARCLAAWTEATGLEHPPIDPEDPLWPRWWSFALDSFNEYVKTYCDAVHAHKPGVLVCSNWLQTLANPGAPSTPTDWISGDNTWSFGMDACRCESRFLATREKHWDIMLWGFTRTGNLGDPAAPWYAKPPEMLMQEAAVILASGGAVQVYENPGSVSPEMRSGQLLPWRQARLGQLGRFIKARRSLCQDTQTIPQIAVLNSEHHARACAQGWNLMRGTDVEPVRGATLALLEKQYNVDILDEWALLRHLDEYPAVVAPECHLLSSDMIQALKDYVKQGGNLLLSGAEMLPVFGKTFLGTSAGKLTAGTTYHIPVGKETVPVYSSAWRLLRGNDAGAVAFLSKTGEPDNLTAYPAATLHRVGKGKVLYVPGALFRDFQRSRNPQQRELIGNLMHKLAGRFPIEVDAATCIDVTMRKKGKITILHLINRNTGLPTGPGCPVVDEIPPVGPMTIKIRTKSKPASVRLAFESGTLSWKYAAGALTIKLESVHLHAAVVIE